MRRFTSAHLSLFALLTIAICFGAASCTEDSPTDNGKDTTTTTVGDTALGRYIVEHVADCGGCHTPRDPNTGLPVAGKTLAGGELFDLSPAGMVYSANITPDSATGIGAWSDANIISAIRTGIHTEMEGGQSVLDTLVVMPYQLYGYMSDADVKAVVAYLRHVVKPVSNEVTEKTINLPFTPYFGKQQGFPEAASNERGRYLTIIGGCNDCHTPRNPDFTYDMTKFLQGGEEFPLGPGAMSISANLTPDSTGLKNWTDAEINRALTEGLEKDGVGRICPPMPWQAFAGMTQTDRDAIIAYLRGIPAVNNAVDDPCN